ncbi:hypothetical protein E4635_04665 [Flavobacterium humi]|uniref:Translational machinery protein n=2 Tax=Flavobacterium humi TaxID=2562683 RepID=A0A4Z0LBP8_9FLAO|nr:hypothetical protein E4635_04665 [Flavobacterium humi]
MKIVKKIGLWMDNSIAYIIEFVLEPFQIQTIESEFTPFEKESTPSHSEKHMHHKEQQLQKEYYKKLSEIIMANDEVLLFGPTNAKLELFNILKKDNRFDTIKIEVRQAAQMTPNQKLAFVRDYFSDN